MKIKLTKRIKIRLIVKPPRLARLFFRKTIWRIDGAVKKLFVTFDDGPIPELTPWILKTLKEYNAKATFFCVGDNVRKHPELFGDIVSAGHGVGNHTYSHLNGFRTSIRRYVTDCYNARKYITSKLFRPPYGRIRNVAQRILGPRYQIILWDVLSMDYDREMSGRMIVRNVVGNASEGSIIVFHDNIKARENLQYALPRILDYYSKRGFEFANLQDEF